MNTRPAEGERRAASGYRAQYLLGAAAILDALQSGDMEWIRVADPEAGRVDDLQIAGTARVEGYQVKWEQYAGTITLHDLLHSSDEKPPLIAQLADGWQRLQGLYPRRKIAVHLVTNAVPSSSTGATMPEMDPRPSPYHFAAFIAQAWRPAQRRGKVDLEDEWVAVWEEIQVASGLSASEFAAFVLDCSLDFQTPPPEEDTGILALCDLLFATAAGAERVIELSREELLRQLGWTRRYEYRSTHRFPTPQFLYRPIQSTVDEVKTKLAELPGGYVGVFGAPGSGKSTLLSQTLRALQIRLIRYYAYVPEAQDPSALRGESINFLHDVTLRLQDAGIEGGERPDPSNRTALLDLFHRQLQALGDDYTANGIKTVILVDGLDHIAREQHPDRSLLRDLPLPQAVPDGVFVVVGSQTDELANLPSRVHHTLRRQERRIQMGRLAPVDVYAIAEESVPALEADKRRQLFEISSGHPLALIYLLKGLRQADGSEERGRLLDEVVPYRGDIEEQYWGHWRDIENDDVLVHALGLLARIRGAIPMDWVADWLETTTLRRLQPLLLQYFEEEGQDRWGFFHNSFRLFLQERTKDLVPGRTRERQNQAYHRELAEHCEASSTRWQWEALYHWYSAGEYKTVLETATQEWFREQVEALRPLDAIRSDVRLALRAAGRCKDVIALARLTLVGAALEQRAWTLEERPLPDLLLEAGEVALAAEHLRDGNRLRVGAERAVRLAPRLLEAGLEREAQRVFELAEPLELLSGRPIPDDHTRPQNLWDLLSEWTRSAVVFRGAEETARIIRRIRIEPKQVQLRRDREEDVQQTSLRLQNWLLLQGALACAERSDWASWQVLFHALDEDRDRLNRSFTLLRSAERTEAIGDTERAREFLDELLSVLEPDEVAELVARRWRMEACLSIAELTLRVAGDGAQARRWVEAVSAIPLEDTESYLEREPAFHELRFRRGQLRYLLGESRKPEALLREAEASTEFGEYVSDEKKMAWRQIALASFQLSRLWAWGHSGSRLSPNAFLQEVRWILDFLGPRWMSHSMPIRLAVTGARTEILRYVVAAAAEHGAEVVKALTGEFEGRWMDPDERPTWSSDMQRELILALADVGADHLWARAQLRRIEPTMLQDLGPYERAEACEAQTEAWLALGETEAAIVELQRMVVAARGILSDDDYQLSRWVRWLGRINELEPERAQQRTRLMLRRLLSVERTASGVVDAAEELLEVVFRRSPRQAVRLLKGFLERRVLGHQTGVTRVLTAALNTPSPPLRELLHTVVDLILPLVPGTEADLLKALIERASDQLGYDAALGVARSLVNRIRADALANSRSGWFQGVADGLDAIGATPDQVGLQKSDLAEQPELSGHRDKGLHLRSGDHLELEEVLGSIEAVEDLRVLLEAEERQRFGSFDWATVVEHLAPQLDSPTELTEVEDLIHARLSGAHLSRHRLSRSFTALSRQWMKLGDRPSAWRLAEQALDATEPSGWSPYFDGGARHAAIRQLIAIDSDHARRIAIDLYARDLSERLHYPGAVVLHLHDVLTLLSDAVPVAEIWPAIENYLDDLFVAVLVEPQPALETPLEEPIGTSGEDTPERAVADLLVLYLDHPSYTVAQAAVQGCTAALLDGSQAATTALQEALKSTDQGVERALMVLDAASIEDPSVAASFEVTLSKLRSSPNFTVRLTANAVYARISDESPVPCTVERETPAVYTLHLPELTFHRTEETLEQRDAPTLIGDPAEILRPLDLEARTVAEAAGVPEDNVLYRAAQHLRRLETARTWLAGDHALDPRRLSVFLDQVGLRHAYYKPHIEPARQALAYTVAELYDGGHLSPDELTWLSRVLIHHDPAFIRWRPDRRPRWIGHIGGIADEGYSYIRVPDDWVEEAEDSNSLLPAQTPEGWFVVGERTRLKHLQENWPEEERMATTRAVAEDRLWEGFDVASGHPPFATFLGARASEYLSLRAPEDHLVIASDGRYFETPEVDWLALNPAFGRILGWQPIPGPWFRWADQRGNLVVKSVWWRDGYLPCYNEHFHVEVGSGWLVLITESGLEDILMRTGCLSRGGVVRRSLGWHGDAGRGQAIGVLELR